MSRSSKRPSKQNKPKNDVQTPSQLSQIDSNLNLKAHIPRKMLHTTSLSYLAAKGSRNDIHSFSKMKSIMKTPIVHRWRNIKGFGIDYFMSAIKPQLWKCFNLSIFHSRKFSFITNWTVDDKYLEALAKSLRHFALDLRQLKFVPKSGQITANGLEKFITQICKYYGKLQSLNMVLVSTFLSDQEKLKFTLHNIIKKLAYSKHLKIEFTFDFHTKKPQIADTLTRYIGLAFSRYFEHLQQLDFSFIVSKGYYNLFKRLEGDPIAAFAVQLGKLKGLQRLALCFKWYETQDKDLAWLGEQIGENLINLNHLALQFIRCDKLTGKGLKQLGLGLCKGSANLKHFKINFKFSGGIYEPDYKGFKLKLKKELPRLEEFLMNDVKV